MADFSAGGRFRASTAIAFEAGLVVLAAGAGWLLGVWPLPGVSLAGEHWLEQLIAIAWGVLAAVPLILGLLLVDRFPCRLWRDLAQTVEQRLLPWMRHWTIGDMAWISLAAGFGEEMLFRGLLQNGLSSLLPGTGGIVLALVIASVVFGLCHWITTTYALMAGVMGVYLGVLLLISENLLTPIATHAVYDFVALVYLTRSRS